MKRDIGKRLTLLDIFALEVAVKIGIPCQQHHMNYSMGGNTASIVSVRPFLSASSFIDDFKVPCLVCFCVLPVLLVRTITK